MRDERHIVLGMLQTQMLTLPSGEVGIMECPVTTPEAAFLASRDKLGLFFKELSMHLVNSIERTGLPAEMWEFHTTPEVQERMAMPAVLPIGNARQKGYVQ